MKKISTFIAVFALIAFFTTGFVHAQTSATIDTSAGVSVDGTGDTRKPGVDKPGTVRPEPSTIDYQPMPKDPAAQKKIMDLEATLKNIRAKCATLASKTAQADCAKKAETDFKKLEADVKATYKISDEDMKRKLEEDRPKTDDQRKEDRPKTDEQRKEDRVENAKNRVANVIKELNALYNRFSDIGNRIEDRIKKLSANNVNVEVSQKYLTAARADLAKAKTEIDAIGAAVKIELTSATTAKSSADSDLLTKTREHLKTAKEALVSAHKNLMDAVRNLKDLPEQTKNIPVKGTIPTPTTKVNTGATVNTSANATVQSVQ